MKKNFKKAVSVILCLGILLSFCACSGDKTNASSTIPETESQIVSSEKEETATSSKKEESVSTSSKKEESSSKVETSSKKEETSSKAETSSKKGVGRGEDEESGDKTYTSITKLYSAASSLSEGDIITLDIAPYAKGQYKVVKNSSLKGDDYSIIDLGDGVKYAVKVYSKFNSWVNNLKSGTFVAHKGFNGWIDNSYLGGSASANGTYPENTLEAVQHAVRLGYKFVEIDITTTQDDIWVLSHDANDTTLSGGGGTSFGSLTYEDIKSRPIVKQWKSGGYWEFSDKLKREYVPTLDSVLSYLKGKGVYVILDAKSTSHTEAELDKLATVIKNNNMTEYCGAYAGALKGLTQRLPGIIAVYGEVPSSNEEAAIEMMRAKGNYMISAANSKVDSVLAFAKKYDVPVATWVVDDYAAADKLFAKGVDFILTNYCLNDSPNLSDYQTVKTIEAAAGKSSVDISFKEQGLKTGDIIAVTAEGSADATLSIGKAPYVAQRAISGKQTLYYLVNDAYENDIPVALSSGEFKSIEIKLLRETARGEK